MGDFSELPSERVLFPIFIRIQGLQKTTGCFREKREILTKFASCLTENQEEIMLVKF